MSATTPRPTGERVKDYRLLTPIGEGGMGVVHLAQAPDGSRVALKVLRPHIVGDREARERLAREVASLRRVRSPRVAEVLDADPWGDVPFVTTRYVPGLSLHQHVRDEGPIGGEDLRWFAACLAEAVIAVHTVGVLHRDIKPSNVLLEGRSPVLIDFGLARVADDPRLTQTGWLLGTPGYLAPEILVGEDATTASDVHSWAATVVFAATGQSPFGGGPAMAIMDRVRRGQHDLTGVPDNVRPLLAQALSPDPQARPEMAAALATLRGSARRAAAQPSSVEQPTMPVALFPGRPDAEDRTRTLGEESPTSSLPTAPPVSPTLVQPARAPFVTPQPPAQGYPANWRPLPRGVPRLQRAAVLLGTFALATVAVARAPYLSTAGLAVLALLVRTYSWTTESSRDRKYRRGRARWYDGPLTLVTTPWYLVVATGGTLLLLAGSALTALVVGVAYGLFRLPLVPGLLLVGGVFSVALWWGPGSRRLRMPGRSLVARATRRRWIGWLSVTLLAAGAALCAYGLAHTGVVWAPADGPPWRSGTALGDLVRWL